MVGIVVNRLIVVVIRVFVIFGVIIVNVVCFIFLRVINVCMIFYIVLNRLIYGLMELIVVKKGKLVLSELILWVIVMCMVCFVFFIIKLGVFGLVLCKWVNLVKLV